VIGARFARRSAPGARWDAATARAAGAALFSARTVRTRAVGRGAPQIAFFAGGVCSGVFFSVGGGREKKTHRPAGGCGAGFAGCLVCVSPAATEQRDRLLCLVWVRTLPPDLVEEIVRVWVPGPGRAVAR
jgi:hypothetical protein